MVSAAHEMLFLPPEPPWSKKPEEQHQHLNHCAIQREQLALLPGSLPTHAPFPASWPSAPTHAWIHPPAHRCCTQRCAHRPLQYSSLPTLFSSRPADLSPLSVPACYTFLCHSSSSFHSDEICPGTQWPLLQFFLICEVAFHATAILIHRAGPLPSAPHHGFVENKSNTSQT